MDRALKSRENRLRYAAERQGLRLMKSRARDPRALDYNSWQIVDPYLNIVIAGDTHGRGYGLTLDQIEECLREGREALLPPTGSNEPRVMAL